MISSPALWSLRRNWRTVALGAIALIALGLRLMGSRYGLPAVYNPDEVAIMNRTLAFGTGDLNPHNFVYPTFYFYALFAWEGLFFAVGRLAGLFDSLAAFERSFFVDPTPIYLAGRTLSAACGVLTVLATYRLGARLSTGGPAVLGALLLAVAPLAVRDAHYVKHDVPVTLLIVVTHVLLAGVLFDRDRSARLRSWIWLGAVAGLAASTHYYAVFATIPIGLAALFNGEPTDKAVTRVMRLAAAATACLVAFIAASPFILVEPGRAWGDVVANQQIVMDRATANGGLFASLGYYAEWLARDAAGRWTFLLAIVGVVATFVRGWRHAVVALAFPIAFLLFIGNTFPASRYLNPLLPFVALSAAQALSSVWARTSRLVHVGLAGVVALAVLDAGGSSLAIDRFFQQDDTRTQAERWIARSVVPGASILVQPYSVPLRMSHAALVEALTVHLGSPARASVKFQRQLALSPYPSPAYRTIYLGSGGLDKDRLYLEPSAFTESGSLAPLRTLSVEYVVLKRYNEPDSSLAALDAALVREGRLIAAFSPYRRGAASDNPNVPPFLHNTDARIDPTLDRPGPTIEIWRIN
jgi:hypothetical protein